MTERNYANSIFVGNVPFTATAQDVQEVFREFDIVRTDIVLGFGKSRGMATVEFASSKDVAEAISKFDRTEQLGREIFVRQDNPPPEKKERKEKPQKAEDPNAEVGYEVFVGNLPWEYKWSDLKKLFSKVGASSIIRADVSLDRRTRRSRGYGTVVFTNAKDAHKAIRQFARTVVNGRELEVREGKLFKVSLGPKNSEFVDGVVAGGEPNPAIFVGNLPYITTQPDLFELFETVGKVVQAELQYVDSGKPAGSAVVQFDSVDSAESAIKNLDGYNYGNRPLAISFAKKGEDSMDTE